jgi:cytochrome c biogenesis protein CcdA
VTVAALVTRSRRLWSASWLAVVWGIGHSLTLFLVGGVIILFNLVVPPRLSLLFEFAVGLALVAMGILSLRPVPPVGHGHGAAPAPVPAWRTFWFGLIHGLAGSAAVALLVLTTVRDPWVGVGYLVVFGLGTMVGMVLVTTSFAAPLVLASGRWPWLAYAIRLVTGTLSIAFGLWLMWDVAFHRGLFGAAPPGI